MTTLTELMEAGLKEVEKRQLPRSVGIALDDLGVCWLGVLALGVDPELGLATTAGALNLIGLACPRIDHHWVEMVKYHDICGWSFEEELAWLRQRNL